MRGNEGVFIMGKTIEFHMGGNMELKAVSIFYEFKRIIRFLGIYKSVCAIMYNY